MPSAESSGGPRERARDYRRLAAECLRLSNIPGLKAYRTLAHTYLMLAEAEEKSAKEQPSSVKPTAHTKRPPTAAK